MFDGNNFFNVLFVIPILNILIFLYKLFLSLHLPGALGLAVIFLTIIIRLLLNPLILVQLKSTQKLNRLKPELEKLAKMYKNDKTRLHQEQLRLYQREGINPAAGCLPLLIQMPLLIALYNLFFQLLGGGGSLEQVIEEVNKVVYFSFLKITSLDVSFLGLSLVQKPSDWQKYGVFLLLVPILTGLLQYWQIKMTMPKTEKKEEEKEKAKEEEIGEAIQRQMSIMMPLMIGFFAYSFPIGLSLYWNTFTLFGIIQQYQINKETTKIS